MQNCGLVPVQTRTGKKTGIWVALMAALGLHVFILTLPVTRTMPAKDIQTQLELQLTTFNPQATAEPVRSHEPETRPSLPEPEPASRLTPGSSVSVVDTLPELEPYIVRTNHPGRNDKYALENMNEQVKARLTSSILYRQFITPESATDRLFGRSLEQSATETQKEFHFRSRQDMISMLDQPMPELPFSYTPGLVHFAYDPGVKGDLQRFWDVITPEFGWRTNNGTEFKCIWVLVIAACGWK